MTPDLRVLHRVSNVGVLDLDDLVGPGATGTAGFDEKSFIGAFKPFWKRGGGGGGGGFWWVGLGEQKGLLRRERFQIGLASSSVR